MKKLQCKNKNGIIIITEIYLAENFFQRLMGLMFIPLNNAKAMLISPTQSIHTCFMKFNIDIVFLDSTNTIVKIIRNLKPWRVTPFYFNAKKVLEVPAGFLPQSLVEGEQLEFNDV